MKNKVTQPSSKKPNQGGSQEVVLRRNVGIQTVQETKFYVSPQILSHHELEKFDYNQIFYTPRTLSTLIFTLLALNFLAYTVVPILEASKVDSQGFSMSSKIGIAASVCSMLAFSSVQYPDTLIKRPHPIFWRVLMGFLSMYTLFMVYLLFQPLDDARRLFQYLEPSLGVPLPEKSYAEDCRIYTPEHPTNKFVNVWDAAVDVHFFAHLFGWWFKMMIIRDVKMCWLNSVLFELLEITFRHWLPNFWECWWDHVFLDVFGCNMLGIMLGSVTCNYLYVGRLNWIYEKPHPVPVCGGMMQTFVNKFKPNVWAKYDWSVFSSLTRYSQFFFFCGVCVGIDCMNFFLKFILWIPANHKILLIRLFMWAFVSIAAAKEYFEFISNKHCKRVGPFVWLSILCLGVEFSITFRFGFAMFSAPFPWYVVAMWGTIFILWSIGAAYAYSNGCKQVKKEKFDPQDPKIDIEPIYEGKKNI